jgi:hypothetical protein
MNSNIRQLGISLIIALVMSVRATATQDIPEVAPEIVSAWKSSDIDALLIFRYDGNYYQVGDSATRPGMERGTFVWDKASGAFFASTVVDTNGEDGLSHLPVATTLAIIGDALTLSVPGQGSFAFARVVNTASAIVGSWFFPGEYVTVTFLADGTYFQTEESNEAPMDYDGMERGTYTWNATTGDLSGVAQTDTNGGVGLSNLGSATATVDGNNLTINSGGESFTLQRITTSAVPIAAPDFDVGKFANYTQTSAAAPSLVVVNPGTGDYPFWAESWINPSVGATAPTLKIGTQTPLSYVEDADGWFGIENDFYATKAALDAAFPEGTTYQLKSGTATANLSYPAGGTFPAVPAVIAGSGTWSAGKYLLDANGTLSWAGHAGYDPAAHVTMLSIKDTTLGVDLLKERLFQGDVTSYDLSGKLTAGHDYWVQLELIKLAGTTTAGIGVFAGKRGYAIYNSNTSFSMQATAPAVAAPTITQQPVSRTVGTGMILSMAADGFPVPTYQWKKNNVALPGQTGNSLTLLGFNDGDRGDYTVTVTNIAGSVTSSVVALSGLPEIQFVLVSKDISYVQTGAATVIVDPRPPVVGSYGGPYGFSARVEGRNLEMLAPPSVTPPAGTPNTVGDLFYNQLAYDGVEDLAWRYGPAANDWGATTQAEIDRKFPSGTYTFEVNGTAVPLVLTGDIYPNTPQVTLSGGTWVNGKYAMDASNPLTITTNAFTEYRSNANGHFGFRVNDIRVRDSIASEDPGSANFSTYTVPASTLPTNNSTYIEIGYDAVANASNVFGTAYAAAVYSKRLTVEVVIIPKIATQSPSQVIAAGGGVTLQVTATGTSGLLYQWQKGGVILDGKTAANLVLTSFQLGDVGSYTCTVSNAGGAVTSQPITLMLPDAYTTFASDNGLDPFTTGAPESDFDKDGIPNILEFVLNGNLRLAEADILPKLTATPVGGGQSMVFRYKRRLTAAGVTQIVEHSATMVPPWTTAVHGENGVTIIPSPVNSTTEQVTVTIPSTDGKRFVRLKVVR